MDGLKSILIFCNDDEYPDIAVTTSLQVEHYDLLPMMITDRRELYDTTRLQLTNPGDWNLICLHRTSDLWLERIVAMRGDVSYRDETIALILAHGQAPINYFYFYDKSLVAFSARSKDIKLAMSRIMSDKYVDIDNWNRLIDVVEALTGKTSKIAVIVGGIND